MKEEERERKDWKGKTRKERRGVNRDGVQEKEKEEVTKNSGKALREKREEKTGGGGGVGGEKDLDLHAHSCRIVTSQQAGTRGR